MSATAMDPPADKLDAAAHAIADGLPVAWREFEGADSDLHLESLHLLEDIAAAFRTVGTSRPAAADKKALFTWGHLQVEVELGRGSFGEVYRAFDPWLERAVALKLCRADAACANNADTLGEARRLAQLRHRHVLSVYGCAIHDDRAGLWTELIQGQTLADLVLINGPFGGEEAMLVGRDLARALACVHGAALVHGDVKAENVMRESGGRIVLMDFGAGGEQRLLASRRLVSGTPRYLPPEVLDGAPLSVQSDLYALGVLLFFLLSGRYPYQESDPEALRRAQRAGLRTKLGQLRPDLDEGVLEIVDRCIDENAQRRPTSANELAAALSVTLAPVAAPEPRPANRLAGAGLLSGLLALACVAAVLLWPRWFPPAFEVQAGLLRHRADGDIPLSGALHLGDQLVLEYTSSRSSFVYLLNEDASGSVNILFPLNGSDLANPLPERQLQLLPGTRGGRRLSWQVSSNGGREEFVMVSAQQALPEFERWIAAHEATSGRRSVGGLSADAPRAQDPQGATLKALTAPLAADVKAGRVRIQRWSLDTAPVPG